MLPAVSLNLHVLFRVTFEVDERGIFFAKIVVMLQANKSTLHLYFAFSPTPMLQFPAEDTCCEGRGVVDTQL